MNVLVRLFLASPLALAGGIAVPASAAPCDRDCLRQTVSDYFAAMEAHAPETLRVAPSFKFTEDAVEMKLGEGLWADFIRPLDYRMDVLDSDNGVAVTFAVIEAGGGRFLHSARFKVDGTGQISELETMVVRREQDAGIMDAATLRHATDAMTFVPGHDRVPTRERAFAIAEYYPAGIRVGSFAKVGAPFSTNAYRLENGRLMAGRGCTVAAECENIKTQRIPTYPAVFRRVAFDEELGVVVLRQNFGPRPNNKTLDLNTWHAFKIYDDQIQGVEAFMKLYPAGTKSGWD